jgi:hypothetical protein
VQNATAVPPPPPPGISPATFQQALASAKFESNPLNDYYSPTYHFRLFVCNDKDVLIQMGNPGSVADMVGALSGKSVQQVTIAESGVTAAFSIKDVEIKTVIAQNGVTNQQTAWGVTLTVTEPLGLSFLDGLLAAASTLDIFDYTKTTYFLELTFMCYEEQGKSTGRPIKMNYANGGRWIWALTSTFIDTKITEGGGVYTLEFITDETNILVNEMGKISQGSQTIKVSGSTLGELFDDYATKITDSWNKQFSTNGNKLRDYKIITHPVSFVGNPHNGADVSKFKTKSTSPDQSSSKMFDFDKSGKITAQIPPNTPISTFITSAINATEEGQALAKDVQPSGSTSQSAAQVNPRKFLEPILFSIELVPIRIDKDLDTGNYCYAYQIHVVPHLATRVILNRTQVENAKDPAVQKEMISSLVNNGMLRKRYDYIFTGKNTEVIDFDIGFKLSWQPKLAKMAGARMGYNNVAVNKRINPVNTQGDTVQSKIDQQVFPVPLSGDARERQAASSADSGPSAMASPPTPSTSFQMVPGAIGRANVNSAQAQGATLSPVNQTPAQTQASQWSFNKPSLTLSSPVGNGGLISSLPQQVQTSLGAIVQPTAALKAMLSGVTSANNTDSSVAKPAQPRLRNPSGSPPQEASSNRYIEDLLDQNNTNSQPNTLPVSFWQGYHVPESLAGSGFTGQWGRDQSVVGSIFAQIYDPQFTGDFQQLKSLTIRGDPFWLGQSNLERQVLLRNNKLTPAANALPDYTSRKQSIYLYFRYPLQIADDTSQPMLRSSESFNGLYEITNVRHTFSDGVFKSELQGIRQILYNFNAANSSNGNSGGAGSNAGLAGKGGAGGNSGITPGPGPGFTLNPTNLPNTTAAPTALQSADTATIGTGTPSLSASQLASYKAAVGQSESGNNPQQPNNKQGFVGQYQMGQAALIDAGYLTPGVGSSTDPMSWQWTGQNGINSLSDWLANPNLQNSAMDSYTQANYATLVNKGVITQNTSPEVVGGLLAAAHIAGGQGAANWANSNGAYNPSDAFGTTPTKYYNLGYNAVRLAPTTTASR